MTKEKDIIEKLNKAIRKFGVEPSDVILTTYQVEEFDEFCAKRNWNPTNMGVEFDHYRNFLIKAIEKAIEEERAQITEWSEKNTYKNTLTKVSGFNHWRIGYNQALTDLINYIN